MALLMRLLCAVTLLLLAFGVQAGGVLTTLYSFHVSPNGANPTAGLVQGGDGNFYGTTTVGGTNGGYGTVFKISTNGVLISLYSFTGGNDGSLPQAGLVQGRDGSFYGTTYYGGTNNYGTVFKISTNGVLTSLHSFTFTDGEYPRAVLVQGSDGNFYGTTKAGGKNDSGTVFKISTNGVLTSLYSFTNGNDGGNLDDGLVQGSDGNFYGTTWQGGTNNFGTVFKISPNGVLTSLFSFTGGYDGGLPVAGLVEGRDGNFYGVTSGGGKYGSGLTGYGTVFEIGTNGVLTSLYSFTGGYDGSGPVGALVQGSDGTFYGTTVSGGTNNYGTMFKISTNGAFTTMYSFVGGSYGDGAYPQAGLVQGTDGNFYGTTEYNGSGSGAGGGYTVGNGTVFKISTNGVLTTLYSFPGGTDGKNPYAGLVQGNDGNFYGTTSGGGTNLGAGTVFKIATNGLLTTLYDFGSLGFTGYGSSLDGSNPQTGLMQGSDGNFYGTTSSGGANSIVAYGTVFKISTNGALTTLYSFTGNADGNKPSALVQGSDGNFYGTTPQGGTNYRGSIFKISANGTLTNLCSFNGANNTGGPWAALVRGTDGNFYGTTSQSSAQGYYSGPTGTVFKASTDGALTTLFSFTGDNKGGQPTAPLIQGSDGNFYGTTQIGGSVPGPYGYGNGTVFKISATGVLTNLYSFTGGNDGKNPYAGLVQGSDGNFYGTTEAGGTNGYGTVLEIRTNGALTTLYSFTGGNDGGNPYAGLVQGSNGSFYGTTEAGGQGRAGTVFRLTIVPEPPKLTIIRSGANVILTWPTDATGFTLQSTTNLVPPVVWTTINGQNAVTNPISGRQMFYRLSQ